MSQDSQNTKGFTIVPSKLAECLDLFYKSTSKGNSIPMPVCVWGASGIGKTETIEQYAKNNGYGFVYLSPAQFEEVGDLSGLPERKEDHNNVSFTTSTPPEWVIDVQRQYKEGKTRGVILMDDFNRADPRIVTALMQVLQRYEFHNWKLPKTWQIVLSANPEGKAYKVTKLDDAVATRLLHLTFKFDVKEWCEYGNTNGYNKDILNFAYYMETNFNETVNNTLNRMLNARSLSNFAKIYGQLVEDFEAKENSNGIKKLYYNDEEFINKVKIAWLACIDDFYLANFISYIKNQKANIIEIEEILNSPNINATLGALKKAITLPNDGGISNDIIYVIFEKLRIYAKNLEKNIETNGTLNPTHLSNLVAFFTWSEIPKDTLTNSWQQLSKYPKSMHSFLFHKDIIARYTR